MNQIIKNILKYFIYYPSASLSYWQSVFNIIKYKIKYENKKYLVFFDQDSDRNSFSSLMISKLIKKDTVILFVGEKSHPAFDLKVTSSSASRTSAIFFKNLKEGL